MRTPRCAHTAGWSSKCPASGKGKVKDGVTNARDSDVPGSTCVSGDHPPRPGSLAFGSRVSNPKTRSQQRSVGTRGLICHGFQPRVNSKREEPLTSGFCPLREGRTKRAMVQNQGAWAVNYPTNCKKGRAASVEQTEGVPGHPASPDGFEGCFSSPS